MSSSVEFSLRGGWLEISKDGSKRQLVRPDGLEVSEVVPSGDGRSAFTLLDASSRTGRVQNLVKVTEAGAMGWRAELPVAEATDSYVAMQLRSDGLLAWTWSGFRVLVDSSSGRLLSWVFAK